MLLLLVKWVYYPDLDSAQTQSNSPGQPSSTGPLLEWQWPDHFRVLNTPKVSGRPHKNFSVHFLGSAGGPSWLWERPAESMADRAATPSASAISNDSDMTHGEQWWLPQPHPSLDESHSEWRPAAPMAEALSCSVCKELLKEAITAAECGHSCKWW